MKTKTMKKIKKIKKKKSTKQSKSPFLARNFNSAHVDYAYDYSQCICDEDICRCREIINGRIINVNCQRLLVNRRMKFTQIENYCIDRLFHIYRAHIVDQWHINIQPGYYGEEACGVIFNHSYDLDTAIIAMLHKKSNHDKLDFVLQEEYGWQIELMKKRRIWKITTIEQDNIIYPNVKHRQSTVEHYKTCQSNIRALCLKNGDNFQLIDGNHRVLASTDKFKILYCNSD